MDLLENTKKVAQRMTFLRSEMVNIFKNSSSPLSAQEILLLTQKAGLRPNRTTIYRELDFFVKNNLIIEVQLEDNKKRYEKTPEGCTHHLVCNSCKSIVHISLGDKIHTIEKSILKETGFNVEKHVVEFYGLCKACKKSN